jgi:group I intron endonuclease
MTKFLIDPSNAPLARPGVYMLQHLESGKRYIGISSNMRRRIYSHGNGGSPRKLKAAIEKHGRSAFSVTPLFYSLTDDTSFLPEIESLLIAEHRSTHGTGYNIKLADGGVGPYGPAFSEIKRADWERNRELFTAISRARAADPKIRKRLGDLAKVRWEDPEFRKKSSEAQKTAQNRPEVIAKRKTPEAISRLVGYISAHHADKEAVIRRLAASAKSRSTPESRALTSKRSAEMWQNDAMREKFLASFNERWSKPGAKEVQSKRMTGLMWINDGAKNARLYSETEIPPGWSRGKVKGAVKWLTDGTKNKRVPLDAVIPDGWREGMVNSRMKPDKHEA